MKLRVKSVTTMGYFNTPLYEIQISFTIIEYKILYVGTLFVSDSPIHGLDIERRNTYPIFADAETVEAVKKYVDKKIEEIDMKDIRKTINRYIVEEGI